MNKLKVVSLFSGIGAFEKALSNINIPYELLGFSEIDKWAVTSYCATHGVSPEQNLGDVAKIDGTQFGEIDLLTHGSPCQSFSAANFHSKVKGGDEGSGTKSSLMWETVRIVQESKPKVVIWENVQAVLNKKNRHNFDRYIETLNELGYTSYYQKINSRDHNVAQNRPRFFVVSILGDKKFEFPEPEELTKSLGDYLDENVDDKYTLATDKLLNLNNKPDFRKVEVRPADTYAYCLVAKGAKACRTNNFVYKDLSMYEKGHYDKYDIEKMVEDGVAIRALTPLEYWRLQGFDDEDFYKAKEALNEEYHKGKDKADAQLYKQAGNSITVRVAEKIFEQLYK